MNKNSPELPTFREKFEAKMKSALRFLWSIVKGIFYFLDKIKFMFTIPLVSLASSILTFIILLLGKTIIVLILPNSWQIGLVESLISTIIFIVLMVIIFRDKIYHKEKFDPVAQLVGLNSSLILWLIPIYFINTFLSDWVSSYLASMTFADITIEPQQAFATIVSILFYSPHMWLSTIFNNYGFVMLICMIINLGIFTLISIRDIRINYVKN